ncbi:hypothetical protein [Clostridium estertheticum]|uniref:hypothetical protein n=1 Tax=Clostridium estertheticum TaxID=238834 RepID=UPI00227A745F|nr:hypothetical protein [Clostridium estertheticum]WAG76394.1 hypothetical protein LL032_23785 [Clostridium estertheticum]
MTNCGMRRANLSMIICNVDSSFAQERTLNNEVSNTTTFKNIGNAKLEGGKDPNKPYLSIAGFSNEAFDIP